MSGKTTLYLRNLLQNLGPGLLFASAAIGTSHLVLSTRAGANYGAQMLLVIILANLFKYPFFEFGVRYTGATQQTLLHGYLRQGRWVLMLYLLVNLLTMFVIIAALTVVTAGLLANIFAVEHFNLQLASVGLLAGITTILIIGQYRFLEKSLKYIIALLFLAVMLAFVIALSNGMPARSPNFVTPNIFSEGGLILLVMLTGWMPTAVEASSWPSLWAVAHARARGQLVDLKSSLQEFNAGYLLTAFLGLVFLGLGAFTLYGSGQQLSGQPVAFSRQLMHLFTENIGGWAYWVVAIAAFAAMFSTCFTAQDAAGRVNMENIRLLFYSHKSNFNERRSYILLLLLISLMSFGLISWFVKDLGFLVELATSISFMIAPLVGFLNLRAIRSTQIPKEARPPRWMIVLAWLGMIFLGGFALFYAWFRWFS